LLNTDWGDHGHYQPLGQSWYGYVYGAAQAWSGGATADEDFDSVFGRLWFGSDGPAIVSAMRELGRLNTLPGMPRPNQSNSITMLLEDPLASQLASTVPPETLDTILRVTAQAEEVFRAAWGTSSDPLTLEEMIHSARWMAYAARKLQVSQSIGADLAEGEPASARAARSRDALRALELELVPLQAEFVRLWRLRARDSEIGQHLGALSSLRERFRLAQGYLDEIANGERDRFDLQAYLAETPPYEILGEHFWRLMRQVNASL